MGKQYRDEENLVLKIALGIILGGTALSLMIFIGLATMTYFTNKASEQEKKIIIESMKKDSENLTNSMKEMHKLTMRSFDAFRPKARTIITNDHLHPSSNPGEWDVIKNDSKICWVHKQSRKLHCEKNQ